VSCALEALSLCDPQVLAGRREIVLDLWRVIATIEARERLEHLSEDDDDERGMMDKEGSVSHCARACYHPMFGFPLPSGWSMKDVVSVAEAKGCIDQVSQELGRKFMYAVASTTIHD